MKKHITDFIVLDNQSYGSQYFSLTIQHPDTMPEILPGQFVEVLVPDTQGVMLRRPISIHDVDYSNNTMTLLIQKVGKGSRRLSALHKGETLNMVYPLGNGFSTDAKNILLVGGGAGTAPLLYLARCLNQKGIRPTILLAGRTADLIPVKEPYAQYGDLLFATDDGSLGEKGVATQHSCFNNSYDLICTCGPTPMMKAVARLAKKKNITCEVSLENTMACGIGACLCCVQDTDEGHKCVCKDGPVFNINHLENWMN